jgi:predicted nucleic-acid-binding protein
LRITADTNILVRAAVGDDPTQSRLAAAVLREAEIVAVTLPTLCEFVWVLARGYGVEAGEIATAIRRLVDSASVRVDRPVVDAGLVVFEAGGDFADGVIAFEGRRLGGLHQLRSPSHRTDRGNRGGDAAVVCGMTVDSAPSCRSFSPA